MIGTICFVCQLSSDVTGGLKQIEIPDQAGKIQKVHVCSTGPCEGLLKKDAEIDIRKQEPPQ